MSTSSADLNWLLVRKYHSRLVKRTGLRKALSAESGNLPNVHTFHASGLVHPKVVDVRAAKEGKGVLVITRNGDAPATQVAKALTVKQLAGGKSHKATNKEIGELIGPYRADRKTLAVARARGILKSQRKPKASKAPRVRSAKAKQAAAAKKTSSA